MLDDWEPPTEAEMKIIAARRERSDRISKLMSGYLLKGYKMLGTVCVECDTILLQDRQGVNYCVACSELDSDADKDNPVINQSAAKSMVREMELSAVQNSDLKSVTTSRAASQGVSQLGSFPRGAEAGDSGTYSTVGEVTSGQNEAGTDGKSKSHKHDHGQKKQNGFAATSDLHFKQETIPHRIDSDSGFPSLTVSETASCSQHKKFTASIPQPSLLSSMDDASSSSLSISRLFSKIEWASKELIETTSVEYSNHLCQLIKAAAEAVVAIKSARI